MQTVTITDINTEDVPRLWPFVSAQMERALRHGVGDYTIEDLYQNLTRGQMRLWIAYSAGEILASAACQIVRQAHESVCYLVTLAGEDMDVWEHGLQCIEDWASANGAVKMIAHTRKGLAKRCKAFGYQERQIIIQKPLVARILH